MINSIPYRKIDLQRPAKSKPTDPNSELKAKDQAWNDYLNDLAKKGVDVSALRKIRPDMKLDDKLNKIKDFYISNHIKYNSRDKGDQRTTQKQTLDNVSPNARSLDDVIRDKGGNCFELTMFTCELLKQSGEGGIWFVMGRDEAGKNFLGQEEFEGHTRGRVVQNGKTYTFESTGLVNDNGIQGSRQIVDGVGKDGFVEDTAYPYEDVEQKYNDKFSLK